ncbi:hypothetical protein BJ165DRAFT_1126974 [Panaeolus papilionaceus]|nr:hypothetical protein BJ165DRAFT_1126974 [Panaeolus papilionaceus]
MFAFHHVNKPGYRPSTIRHGGSALLVVGLGAEQGLGLGWELHPFLSHPYITTGYDTNPFVCRFSSPWQMQPSHPPSDNRWLPALCARECFHCVDKPGSTPSIHHHDGWGWLSLDWVGAESQVGLSVGWMQDH